MARYTLIVELYDGQMEFQNCDAIPALRPGDTLAIELRDYTPPDECLEDLKAGEDGAAYYLDESTIIAVANA